MLPRSERYTIRWFSRRRAQLLDSGLSATSWGFAAILIPECKDELLVEPRRGLHRSGWEIEKCSDGIVDSRVTRFRIDAPMRRPAVLGYRTEENL